MKAEVDQLPDHQAVAAEILHRNSKTIPTTGRRMKTFRFSRNYNLN